MNEAQQQAALMAQVYPVIVLALIVEGGKAMREAKREGLATLIGFGRAAAGMGCIVGLLTSLLTVFELMPTETSNSVLYSAVTAANLVIVVAGFAAATLPGLMKDDDLDSPRAQTQRQRD